MNLNGYKQIEERLLIVLSELERQPEVAKNYQPGVLPYNEEINQIKEYIELAGEYGLAYETIVASLEEHPFILSGIAAVKLLEVGLLMGFKTERVEDNAFNRIKMEKMIRAKRDDHL
jgi:hypothetical protein